MPNYKVKVYSYRTITKETVIEIDTDSPQLAESEGMQRILKNDDFWSKIDEKLVNNDYSAEVLEDDNL